MTEYHRKRSQIMRELGIADAAAEHVLSVVPGQRAV